MKAQWIKSGTSSECLRLDDECYISYNAGLTPSIFDTICLRPENIGRPETAFVYDNENKIFGNSFLILWGDWKQEFEDAFTAGGKQGCFDLFNKHIEHMADTSEQPIENVRQ